MALLYTGYGQQRGFDPVDIPDPSERIRKRGLKQIEHMTADMNWNQEETKRLGNALAENRVRSLERMEENNLLRKRFNQMFAEAEWRQKKSQIDRATQKAEQGKQWQRELLAFTKSGTAFLAQREAERESTIKALWKDHTDKWGLNPQIVDEVNKVKGNVWRTDMQSQAIYKKLAARGVPHDVIEKLHGLGNYGQIAIAENYAVNRTRRLAAQYELLGNEQITIGGETTTFNAAYASGDPRLLQEAFRQLDLKVDDVEGGPIDAKTMESSGSWRIKEQIHAGFYRNQLVNSKKKAVEAEARKLDSIFTNQLNQTDPLTGLPISPGQAYLNTINWIAGEGASGKELASAREQLDQAITGGLAIGLWDPNTIKDIGKHSFKPNGSAKIKTIEEHWPVSHFAREKALIARQGADIKAAQIASNEFKAQEEAYLGDTYDFLYGGEKPDGEAIMQRFIAATKKGYTKSAGLLQRAFANQGAGGINDAAGLLRTQALVRSGAYIPSDWSENLNLTPPVKAQVDALIAKHNRYAPTTGDSGTGAELTKWIQYKLESRLPSKSDFQKSPTSLAARREAYSRAVKYYKAHIMKHGFDTHADALKYATDMMTQEIEDKEGKWRVELNTRTGKRDFAGFRADVGREVERFDVATMVANIRSDETYLDNTAVHSRAAIKKHYTALSKGLGTQDVPLALVLEDQTGVPAHIQLERQRLYYNNTAKEGEALIPEAPASYFENIDKQLKDIAPALRYKLSLNDPTQINAAYAGSGKPLPYIMKPIKYSQNYIMNTLDTSYNNIDDGTGQLDSDGFNLVDLSISQVLSLGDKRYGAFKLNASLIEGALQKAGLDHTSKFNTTNQNKLFEVIFRSQGLAPWLEDLNRPLIDGTTIADPEDLQKIEEAYKSLTEAFNPRSTAWVRPELQQYLEVA